MKHGIKSIIAASRPGRVLRGLISLLVLTLVAVASLMPFFPTRVTPGSASADRFSAERALAHLPVIAAEPHPQGSPAQARLRDYLVRVLAGYDIEVEVQQAQGVENVVARLHGSDPTGAIVILAHYDSAIGSPGAADNGSGVAALLEIMRALTAGPAPRNDVIALFDDGEEEPDIFLGTITFIRQHHWMADVRVAIGMDTAVRGYICTDDTGSRNGWMVHVLARAYTGGAWYSISGGGNYDSKPFRDAGIQVLELEDNYPFYEQHTLGDVPAIVNPGTLQQLGEQALSVARQLALLDLESTGGEQEAFASLPIIGFIHYPESLSLIFAVLAVVIFIAAFVLAFVRKLISWRGLAVAFLAVLVVSVPSALGVNALWKAAPDVLGWETSHWSEWPEVIPPHGWLILILSNLLVLGVMVVMYHFTRRWSSSADFSLMGLSVFLLLTVAFSIALPRAAIMTIWPTLVGSTGWLGVALLYKGKREWLCDFAALLAAVPIVMFILPLIPGVFMGDGTKSVALLSVLLPLILALCLPAVDGLLVRRSGFPG